MIGNRIASPQSGFGRKCKACLSSIAVWVAVLVFPQAVVAQTVIVEDFESPPVNTASGYNSFATAFPPGSSQVENSRGTAGMFFGPNITVTAGGVTNSHLDAPQGDNYAGLHSNGRFTQEVVRVGLNTGEFLQDGVEYTMDFFAHQMDLGTLAGSEFQHPGFFDFYGIRVGQANPTAAQQNSSTDIANAGYAFLGTTPLIDHVNEWRSYSIQFTPADTYDRVLIVPRSRTGARGDSAFLAIDFLRYSVNLADLVTEKTLASANTSVPNGDPVSFQIEVTNDGPSDTSNVTLTDLLPAGLSPAAGNGQVSAGTYTAATGVWTIPNLALNASATLTLVGTVDADQQGNASIQNITTAATSDRPDPTTVGDDLTEGITVTPAPE